MIEKIKKASTWFFKIITKLDILVIIFALILMHNLHWLVETFYPIVGEPSMSWIYNTVFGLTRGSIVIGYAYLMFRIFFPHLYKYLEESSVNDFKNLEWRKRLYITLLLYAFFLSFFLVSVVTM